MSDGRWREEALCRQFDPEIWFVVTKGRPAADQRDDAKDVCHQCPVEEKCLRWALDHPGDAAFGIWGGLDEEERRSLRRREQRQAYKANGGGR